VAAICKFVVICNDRTSTDIVQQLAVDVHQFGWREAIAEPKLRDDIYYSIEFSFEQRMTLVEKVLHVSYHLFKVAFC
jgi:hypothetical protein